MKSRKNILIVDNSSELEQLVRQPLTEKFKDSDVSLILIRARDGAEASIKSENQRFDMVLIDTEVPRLMDGGFVYGLRSYKNTQEANLLVVSQKLISELPEPLRDCSFFKKPVDIAALTKTMMTSLNFESHSQAAKPAAQSPKKSLVDVRVINTIISSTLKVLGQFGLKDIKMDKATLKDPTEPLPGEISSVVDLKSSAFQGHLCISFDKNSYLEVVSNMLMEEQTELTPDNQDAVGEINNIIFGNAKGEISNYGFELTVPKVLVGKDVVVPSIPGSAGMMVPFQTTKGHFYIFVVAKAK